MHCFQWINLKWILLFINWKKKQLTKNHCWIQDDNALNSILLDIILFTKSKTKQDNNISSDGVIEYKWA